ncbi:MAG: site-2 protease family protein [Clostridia bacterium]|nr:site-2 protease family protein [Clostridia bacterium]
MLSLFSREGILGLIVSIPGLLLAISLHEFAHGYAAYLMGDPTAKYSGRLSLNPMHHLDLMGALCMLFFRFGWAKPVPIDSRYFKNRRAGIVLVSLAGPFANFILGFLFCLAYYGINAYMSGSFVGPSWVYLKNILPFFSEVCRYGVFMNVGLMIFNLIPIPPLDGSKILMEFLPGRIKYRIYEYERYFGIILIIIVYAGVMSPVLSGLRSYIINFYEYIAGLIFFS